MPEFGGAFVDTDGVLAVYLTRPEAAGLMRVALAAELEKLNRPGKAVRVLRGQYAFAQLQQWLDRVTPELPGSELVFTEVDERSNRLRIGVAREPVRSLVQEVLSRVGVPASATVIEVVPTPEPYIGTLRWRISPLTAGSLIEGFTWDLKILCTYGPNVLWQGAKYMLVNSYCTAAMGGATAASDFFQPNVPTYEYQRASHEVGDEVQDRIGAAVCTDALPGVSAATRTRHWFGCTTQTAMVGARIRAATGIWAA